MAWIYLLIAGVLEVCWAIGLKYTNGFTNLWPSIFTVSSMAVGFGFLSLAVKYLPMGTAYAVWTGIGILGTSLFGIILLGESRDVLRILCILTIASGIIGLKLVSPQ